MSGHQERLLKGSQRLVNRLKSSTIIVLDKPTYFITVVQAPDSNIGVDVHDTRCE